MGHLLQLPSSAKLMILHFQRKPEEVMDLTTVERFTKLYPELKAAIKEHHFDPLVQMEHLIVDNTLMDNVYKALIKEGKFELAGVFNGEREFNKEELESRVEMLMGRIQ